MVREAVKDADSIRFAKATFRRFRPADEGEREGEERKRVDEEGEEEVDEDAEEDEDEDDEERDVELDEDFICLDSVWLR